MPEDWVLVHRVRWVGWLPLSLYGSLVELFMGLIGLAGLINGIGFLLGLIPMPEISRGSGLTSYALVLTEIAFALFLAWSGIQGAAAAILDIFTPALTYEGPLEQISEETRQTKNSSYRVFVLAASGKQWELAHHDLANRFDFTFRVKAGMQIRLTYRRGTSLVTQVSVRPAK